MADLEVRQDDYRTTRLAPGEPPAMAAGDGEVQLAIDRFGLTANNVTYAVFGDQLAYWKFFPASEDGWGRVPVWGLADVVASRVPGIDVGERFYGFFPMSTHVTVRPEPGRMGFVDVAEHRKDLPGIYNEYLRMPPDAPKQDETILLRPLFGTAFLLDAFLREHDGFGAAAVVLSSASSKTAYGLASLLARAEGGPSVVGLTSAGNRPFVASLGVYDEVVTYDEIADGLAGEAPLVFVDVAGDAKVRAAVHRTAGDRLRHSAAVGFSHWDQEPTAPEPLPGPAPEFFFAPTHLARLRAELGPGELGRRMEDAWRGFLAQVGDWMDIQHAEGTEAVVRAWLDLVDGEADPRQGRVLRLEPVPGGAAGG